MRDHDRRPATDLPMALKDRVTVSPALELPKAVAGVSWRRVRHGDIPVIVRLANACNAVDSPWEAAGAEDFKRQLDDPDVDLTQDSVIGLDPQGRAVAYGLVCMCRAPETLVWVSLDGWVSPERRGQGIGSALLSWQEHRGRQLLSSLDSRLPALVAADVWDGSEPGALLQAHGYTARRWWLELERDLRTPLPTATLPVAYRIAGYAGHEEASRGVHNLAFRDHWGSQPIGAQEWQRHHAQTRADLSFVVLGAGPGGTDEVLAYVICVVPLDAWQARGRRFGGIEVIGVHPRARGLGLASGLLVHAMRALRNEGLESVVLHVDADSRTGAVRLYERLGFQTVRRSVTLAKAF